MKKLVQPKPRRKVALTVIEFLVATALMTAVFMATMEMFVQTGRSAQRLIASGNASQESQKTMQLVAEELREAVIITLPTDTGTNAWSFGTASQYQSTRPSGTEWSSWAASLNTGIYMMLPATTTAKVSAVNGSEVTLSNADAVVDRMSTSLTRSILIFRGNPDGSVNPSYGTCLWAWYFERQGSNVVKTRERLLSKFVSSEWNAVTFARQSTGLTKSITVKIVASEWSLDGIQSSESKDKVSKLPGRSVLIRNSPLGAIVNPIIPPTSNLPSPNTSPTPTPTPSPTATPTPTPKPTATPTPVPTATPTPKPTGTPTPVPTATPTPTPKPTATPVPTATPKPTASPVPTATPKPTATPTPTPKPTATPTPSPTPTPTPKPTATPTPKPTGTPTPTPKPTATPTPTPKPLDLGLRVSFHHLIAESTEENKR
ncbi:MAG: hypothetical protein QM758_21130 [Armatimonas sp.]